MIVLDANVLIALLDPGDVHHDAVEGFLDDRIDEDFVASVVTVAEALVRPALAGRAEETDVRLARFGLRVEALPSDGARALAELRAATRLKMPDAVVLFTALTLQAALATADLALMRAAVERDVDVHRI